MSIENDGGVMFTGKKPKNSKNNLSQCTLSESNSYLNRENCELEERIFFSSGN
jgi:hypothetical protein